MKKDIHRNLLWIIIPKTQLENARSTQLLQSVIHVYGNLIVVLVSLVT